MPGSSSQSISGKSEVAAASEDWRDGSGAMPLRRRFLTHAAGLVVVFFAGVGSNPLRAAVDYVRDIKPLLSERCYACHGALKQKANLRLDTVALILRGGENGAAVERGKPDASLLMKRVTTTAAADRMPPEHEGEPLKPSEVARLRDWIAAGAPAPADETAETDPKDHWAFRPRVRPPVPGVTNAKWARHPIDAFLAKQHEEHGLTPQPEASRPILLRRLHLDLIGLPPSLEEITAFESDPSPDWYEREVERLLHDKRHGERWARHWMDVWRYSDWWGLGQQLRNSQPHLWHWRDWIVESLNDDLPYDEMVRQMLAADELYPNDLSKLRATGFLARNWYLFNRNQWMDETVEHVGKGFLGLTLNCSKCHDHKYDPISQVDYYKMRAFFEPYHVRMDMLPGEAELSRDGIPRVFDAMPAAPTYLFVRGEESHPDKSVVIGPGVPEVLSFAALVIQPVPLPPEAWQPERRPWVLDAHIAAAKRKLVPQEASDAPSASGQDLAALKVAELACAASQSEFASVESRASAQRAAWEGASDEPGKIRAAIRAEREAALAKASHSVADAELRLERASAAQKPNLQKQLAAARDVLDKATKATTAAIADTDRFTPLAGARWTPTRFASSGADDPAVPFSASSTGRRSALAGWLTDSRHPLTARVAVNHLWSRHLGVPMVPSMFEFGRKNPAPVHPELLDWLASELVGSGWSMKHLHRLIVTSAVYRMRSSSVGGEGNASRDPDNLRWWRREPIRLESQAVRDSILALAGELDLTMGGPPVPPAAQAASKRRSLYFTHSNNERNTFLTTFDEADVRECYRRDQSVVPQQALALSNSALVLDSAARIAGRVGGDLSPEDDAAFARLAFRSVLCVPPSEPELAACVTTMASLRALPGITPAQARAQLVWALLNHNDFVTLR